MKEGKIKNFKLYRLMVFGVLILAYMAVFFHRLAVGIVREDLIMEFNMSNIAFANLSSTYFYAYMLMQIPSGILADYPLLLCSCCHRLCINLPSQGDKL